MIITLFNKKGGVGKTSLAYNIARDLGFYLISNDDSVIEDTYKDKAKVMTKIKLIENENIVYDLGGFTDRNIVDILKKSDIIIVPTISDINSLKRTVNTIKEIKNFNEKVITVANIVKKNEEEFIKEYLKIDFKIRESKIFQKSFLELKSISEIVNESNLHKYRYRNIYQEYISLLNYLKDLIELDKSY